MHITRTCSLAIIGLLSTSACAAGSTTVADRAEPLTVSEPAISVQPTVAVELEPASQVEDAGDEAALPSTSRPMTIVFDQRLDLNRGHLAAVPRRSADQPAANSANRRDREQPDTRAQQPTEPTKTHETPTTQPPNDRPPADPIEAPTPVATVDEVAVATRPPETVPAVFKTPTLPDCNVFGDVPPGASSIETVVIDLDQDGVADTATTYFVAIGDSAGWRLRTELANGPMDDIAIEGVSGVSFAEVLGGIQVDHQVIDPTTWRPELLVRAGGGSSGANLAVFGLGDDDCLFRFENDFGADLVIPVHSTIGVKSGLRCDATAGHQFLVRLSAELFPGFYNTAETVLERQGNALVPGTVIYNDVSVDDPNLADLINPFETLTCGGLSL